MGKNYLRRSKNIRKALGAKNKSGFIDGSLPEPDETDKNFAKWKRADFMVGSWIMSSMATDIAEDFSETETAFELWNEIRERFGQKNGPLIYQLKKEIAMLRQENMTVLGYCRKIKKMWDELKSLRAFPVCTCKALSKCTCDFLKRLADLDKDDKLMQFLLGLNSGFDSTISHILTMDPLPSVNQAFGIIQQIQTQKGISIVQSGVTESNALVVHKYQTRGNSGSARGTEQGKRDWKQERMNRFCEICKMKGHTSQQCFKVIRYPEWYTTLKNGKGQGSQYNLGSKHRLAANVTGNNQLRIQQLDDTPRLAANVTGNNQLRIQQLDDTPLEESESQSTKPNAKMVSAVCQEVMKAMKMKTFTAPDCSEYASTSFAGPY